MEKTASVKNPEVPYQPLNNNAVVNPQDERIQRIGKTIVILFSSIIGGSLMYNHSVRPLSTLTEGHPKELLHFLGILSLIFVTVLWRQTRH